jgi:CBS domain-containing protein
MSKPVIVVDGSTSVAHAMTLMRRRNIHSLVVDIAQQGKPVHGIVTTTDIRDKIVEAGRNPGRTTVAEIMSHPVHTAAPNWTLPECAQRMHQLNIHHMPVADADGVFIGIISATDIFAAVEETGWDALG